MSKDGGSAFPGQWMDFQPGTGEQVVREQWAGMSLRDWFAGMSIAAINENFAPTDDKDWASWVARCAYEVADAMIAERNKEVHNDEERT